MNIKCPQCSADLEASEELRGQEVACPQCGMEFCVPDDSEVPPQTLEREAVPSSKELTMVLILALCLFSGHARGRIPVAVEGWSPLERVTIVNVREARQAQLKIGWACFENANAWYNTSVCKDKRWRWLARNLQNDRQKGQYVCMANSKPAPRTEPFAAIAVEYLAKRGSSADATPRLIVGSHVEPSAQGAVTGTSYVFADPPLGNDRRSETIGYLSYTQIDGKAATVYRRDMLIRKLWFLTGPEVQARTFTLLIEPHKPVYFTVPDRPPLHPQSVE